MFSYNHVRLWEAGSGEQGVLIPLDAMLPTQTSPADSSLPFNNSTSLTDVIDASTGTVWAPSPRTMILHVITGCCGSIWEIIPTPCLDGPSAHVAGEVRTQNTQPELEGFASFAASGVLGVLWAAG